MRVVGKKLLIKLKRKNIGNSRLSNAIDDLIEILESNNFSSFEELKMIRKDADKVHADGFCFFNLNVHRTMILVEFDIEEATIVWGGTHDEYESTFKNNKDSIERWLKSNGWIN